MYIVILSNFYRIYLQPSFLRPRRHSIIGATVSSINIHPARYPAINENIAGKSKSAWNFSRIADYRASAAGAMTRQIQATDIHLPDRWMHRDGSAARCRGQHRGGIPSLGLAYLVSFEVAAAANSRQALVLHAYHCVSPVITPRGRRPWRAFMENAFSPDSNHRLPFPR